MDPQTHRRFLDYLELRGYFARSDMPKLDAESFAELDSELSRLLELERSGSVEATQSRRIGALRKILFRD